MKLHFVSRLLLPSLVCLTLSGILPASAKGTDWRSSY
nr:endonuclease [Serratia proteamaculans]